MKFLSWLWNRGTPSFVPDTSDRETTDVSRALTPQKVDAIMRAANGGDTRGPTDVIGFPAPCRGAGCLGGGSERGGVGCCGTLRRR